MNQENQTFEASMAHLEQMVRAMERVDVVHYSDLSEEVARFYGYNNIPCTLVRGETTRGGYNPATVAQLSAELGIDPVLSSLLVHRGIRTFEEARLFFRPSLEFLHDPFLMKDMDKAVERISKAISAGEKILIYGDYDVDGTTAVSLVYSFLRKITGNIDFYIPDRYDEGYGVSAKGIGLQQRQ